MSKTIHISGLYKYIVATYINSQLNPWTQLSAPVDSSVVSVIIEDQTALENLLNEPSPWDKSMTLLAWMKANRTRIDLTITN